MRRFHPNGLVPCSAAPRYAVAVTHPSPEANGIRVHVAEQGSGPLVLMLHGFPESWYSWRSQLPALAAAGFHAVAPDLRGHHLTDKPREGYGIETLVDDMLALREQLGADRQMHLVGHDWGGVIAWQVAWRHPDALRSLTIMNAPHPAAFAEYVRRSPSQMLKSAYMAFSSCPACRATC
jgi:pimeloyl-ACP methyl ester carboxylesterase